MLWSVAAVWSWLRFFEKTVHRAIHSVDGLDTANSDVAPVILLLQSGLRGHMCTDLPFCPAVKRLMQLMALSAVRSADAYSC